MDLDSKTLSSFKDRAETYDVKMEWVKDKELILPLLTMPFGSKKMLEICAGTGVVSSIFKEYGWDVVMLDSSKEMLMKSEKMKSIVGDMHKLPFDDNSFDLVVCRQGLQYANLEKVFKEVYRVCKKEFRIAHITKVEADKFDFWNEYFKTASPGRKHIFYPGELEKVAEQNNFKVYNKTILIKQDNYIGPIMYLSKKSQYKLIDLLINSPDEFKELYDVKISDTNITYNNRWEFLTLVKC